MPFDPNLVPGFLGADTDNWSGKGAEVTPSDSADQLAPNGRYYKYFVAGSDGDIEYLPMMNDDGDTLTVTLTAGQPIQARVRRIYATGTTATVHAFWD